MRVLVAMSGGVDSSVAAALLRDEGHEVVGATMKLWGGASDSGCCSVADVDDARRVAQQLGLQHHVFNFTEDFAENVVAPYVEAHVAGRTPNPCIECNRHLKFDRFVQRATALGFDAVATGHHARIVEDGDRYRLCRGVDRAKDQSYVLSMLDQAQLASLRLPVGEMTKDEVRRFASELGLRTADKPDSQDVCFITSANGRRAFLEERTDLTPGKLVDAASGDVVGTVDAVELVTIGQRRGLGGGAGSPRFALQVDIAGGRVVVGREADLLTEWVPLTDPTWVDEALPVDAEFDVQTSAHGIAAPAVFHRDAVRFAEPQRRVAPGQTVAFYDADVVLGSATAGSATTQCPGERSSSIT